MVSPAEGLRGRYHNEALFPTTKQEYDYAVRTWCLRDGDRCISHFLNTTDGTGKTLVFANGKWNRNSEYAATVCTTGDNRIVTTGEFPLPQPPQNPIPLLTGQAHQESTSPDCKDWDFEEKFIRTGN